MNKYIERVEPSTELLHTTAIPSPIQSAVSNPVPITQTLYRQAAEVLERVWSQVGESKARYASDISLGSGAIELIVTIDGAPLLVVSWRRYRAYGDTS